MSLSPIPDYRVFDHGNRVRLLKALDIDPTLFIRHMNFEDWYAVRQDAQRESHPGMEAPSLAQVEEVKCWIESKEPQPLLIGNIVTPNLCVEIIDAMSEKESCFQFHLFCHRHTDCLTENLAALVKNMITQIVKGGGVRISDNIVTLAENSTETPLWILCHLLEKLKVNLEKHNSTIFCIIDNVSYFETSKVKAEMADIISQLMGLANKGIIKLLVTTSASTGMDEDSPVARALSSAHHLWWDADTKSLKTRATSTTRVPA